MNKTLVLTPEATRGLDRLSDDMAERIVEALYRYALTGAGDVKSLKGSDLARLRVGDYRVLFRESGDRLILAAIAHRREAYR